MSDEIISILIPVYNRADALEAVFPSYLQQRHVREIVLVDDSSTDHTPAVMEGIQAQSDIPVQIIRHDMHLGQPRARQTALEGAHGEWVLFGEDDVVLAPDYTSTLLLQAHELDSSLIAGRLVNLTVDENPDMDDVLSQANAKETPTDPAFDLDIFGADFDARPDQPVEVPFLHSIALIRKNLFESLSFDPGFAGNSVREETDFYLSATEAGHKLIFSPDTVCFHLRGPLSDAGGHRMPRWKMEFWNLVNTRRLVTKHWALLESRYGFRGTPTSWMLRFIFHRYYHVLRHAITRRSLQAKNRT